jgi:hypothetical protein
MKKFTHRTKQSLLLLLWCIAGMLYSGKLAAQTWYVDVNHPTTTPNGTQQHPFKTIGAAILAANAWDPLNNANTLKTIFIASGTYSTPSDRNMNILVNKLRIVGDPGSSARGPAANAPIIDGLNTAAYCFAIAPSLKEITIEGLFIRNFSPSTPVHGLGTQSGTNGTGIWAPFMPPATQPANPHIEKLVIKDIQFDNMITSILLRHPLNVNYSVFYKELNVSNNVINTVANSQHGIYVENPVNALIDNNEIKGNAAISAQIGIEIAACRPGGGFTVISENITISNNLIEYNAQTNIAITNSEQGGLGTSPKQINITGPAINLRNINIINNILVNNNTAGANTTPIGAGWGKHIRVHRNNIQNASITIENVKIEKNNIKYFITNGAVTHPNAANAINSSTYILDVQGTNTYKENTYFAEFNPPGLIITPPASRLLSIALLPGRLRLRRIRLSLRFRILRLRLLRSKRAAFMRLT